MRTDAGTEQETKSAQVELFRLAASEAGLSIKALAHETGIPESTLASYNRSNPFARSAMPMWVFVALCRVLPDEVTSVMLADAGKHVGSNETSDGDIDELAVEASGLTHEILEAKRDGKVTHIERAKISARGRKVAARARAVAA